MKPYNLQYRISTIMPCIIVTAVFALSCPTLIWAKTITCPAFYLKADDGRIINPLTGENADQPYSPRQTCGACHDYDKITKGYHFQQGWDNISDNFNTERPWALSPGMMGKM